MSANEVQSNHYPYHTANIYFSFIQDTGTPVTIFQPTAIFPVVRRIPKPKCETLPCFNGGECVQKKLCDCGRYNASGSRCQIVYNTGAERDSICRTWGQNHFETFDGVYYFFSGKFTYDLLRQNEPDQQSFAIQLHNDGQCQGAPYSCQRSFSLYFAGEGEIKLQKQEVLHNQNRVQLPYTVGNVRIQRISGYVIVRQLYVFTLAWDGSSAVYIRMSPDFLGKTHGLCGNNNGVQQDDLVTSYGKVTENMDEFVNSWRENSPVEVPEAGSVPSPNEPACAGHSQEAKQTGHSMCSLIMQPPFLSCHESVSPFPFMAACANDMCLSGSDRETWCRALSEYARACAQAGHPLHGWRAVYKQCEIQCDKDLVYNECIDCCPTSCQQRKPCIDSEISCVDGCYCAQGFIYENGACVPPSACPCDFHGMSHHSGSVVQEDCNNCTCTEGKWICTNMTCPAECSVTGDIHIMTFDGRKYTFQAPCQYILAKSLSSGIFTVTLQNTLCGQNQDGSCIQSVNVILHQDPKKQVTLTRSGDVLVFDQYKVSLPYTDDVFEVRRLSSVFVQVKTNIGLHIRYDREGLRLYLQLDARWKGHTIGLCGTFNENMQDDFLSPVGVPESTPQLFGNSWKTSSACSSNHFPSPLDPCDVHLQAASYASESCSVLTKDLFAPCHPFLSPVSYYEMCRGDTCKCGQTCMCSALAHYTHQCRQYGIHIDFRSSVSDCGITCEDSMQYGTCVTTCGRSCQALSVPETCNGECAEGCACPPGTYLDTKSERCVERSECPCYFQGIHYSPGENIITSLGKCLCNDGIMNCESSTEVQTCPIGQIYYNCSRPELDAELSRERTCENQLLNLTMSAHLPCLSGCVCPKGLVKHGDECFEPDACPCSWKAKEYFPGDVVNSSCHTCVCQHGSFQCSFHPCPSMCTTYGDRHYRTFDGLSFDFVGACKVHLVKALSPTSFSVIVENVNCYNMGIICRKLISIHVGHSLIIFNDDTGNPSSASVLNKRQNIHIWQAGFFTFVHFPAEQITLVWDQRTTIHLQVGPQWQGELSGLCGNFDLKTVNEMRTPDNFDLTNSQEFGNSWAAVECADSSDIRNPCNMNPLREPFAKKECAVLMSELFEACHPVVDVTWFYSNCLSDTCGCSRGGDCECFCTSVSAYAHQCCQQGVAIDWRSPRLCPYDCEYFNKVLGKGPYRLVTYLDRSLVLGTRPEDGGVFAMRGGDSIAGGSIHFMLTPGLYKPRAHDRNLVSLEIADRPNYFLHVGANGTLHVAKWQKSEEFHSRSTFVIHKNTWIAGYNAFESFAKPGHFVRITASAVFLTKYHHSVAFRLSTIFRLAESNSRTGSRPICEWRYDACGSACFRSCRDPLGEYCRDVPKVEGCIPLCPPEMVLDEVTRKCVFFDDCIEPALGVITLISTPAPTKLQTLTPAVTMTTYPTVISTLPPTTQLSSISPMPSKWIIPSTPEPVSEIQRNVSVFFSAETLETSEEPVTAYSFIPEGTSTPTPTGPQQNLTAITTVHAPRISEASETTTVPSSEIPLPLTEQPSEPLTLPLVSTAPATNETTSLAPTLSVSSMETEGTSTSLGTSRSLPTAKPKSTQLEGTVFSISTNATRTLTSPLVTAMLTSERTTLLPTKEPIFTSISTTESLSTSAVSVLTTIEPHHIATVNATFSAMTMSTSTSTPLHLLITTLHVPTISEVTTTLSSLPSSAVPVSLSTSPTAPTTSSYTTKLVTPLPVTNISATQAPALSATRRETNRTTVLSAMPQSTGLEGTLFTASTKVPRILSTALEMDMLTTERTTLLPTKEPTFASTEGPSTASVSVLATREPPEMLYTLSTPVSSTHGSTEKTTLATTKTSTEKIATSQTTPTDSYPGTATTRIPYALFSSPVVKDKLSTPTGTVTITEERVKDRLSTATTAVTVTEMVKERLSTPTTAVTVTEMVKDKLSTPTRAVTVTEMMTKERLSRPTSSVTITELMVKDRLSTPTSAVTITEMMVKDRLSTPTSAVTITEMMTKERLSTATSAVTISEGMVKDRLSTPTSSVTITEEMVKDRLSTPTSSVTITEEMVKDRLSTPTSSVTITEEMVKDRLSTPTSSVTITEEMVKDRLSTPTSSVTITEEMIKDRLSTPTSAVTITEMMTKERLSTATSAVTITEEMVKDRLSTPTSTVTITEMMVKDRLSTMESPATAISQVVKDRLPILTSLATTSGISETSATTEFISYPKGVPTSLQTTILVVQDMVTPFATKVLPTEISGKQTGSLGVSPETRITETKAASPTETTTLVTVTFPLATSKNDTQQPVSETLGVSTTAIPTSALYPQTIPEISTREHVFQPPTLTVETLTPTVTLEKSTRTPVPTILLTTKVETTKSVSSALTLSEAPTDRTTKVSLVTPAFSTLQEISTVWSTEEPSSLRTSRVTSPSSLATLSITGTTLRPYSEPTNDTLTTRLTAVPFTLSTTKSKPVLSPEVTAISHLMPTVTRKVTKKLKDLTGTMGPSDVQTTVQEIRNATIPPIYTESTDGTSTATVYYTSRLLEPTSIKPSTALSTKNVTEATAITEASATISRLSSASPSADIIRITQLTSQRSAFTSSLSQAYSAVSSPLKSTGIKELIPESFATSPSFVSAGDATMTMVKEPTHLVGQVSTMTTSSTARATPPMVTMTRLPSKDKAESLFTSTRVTSGLKELSSADAYKTTGQLSSVSQPGSPSVTVSETLAPLQPTPKGSPAAGLVTEEMLTPAITITRDKVSGTPKPVFLSTTTYSPPPMTMAVTATSVYWTPLLGFLSTKIPTFPRLTHAVSDIPQKTVQEVLATSMKTTNYSTVYRATELTTLKLSEPTTSPTPLYSPTPNATATVYASPVTLASYVTKHPYAPTTHAVSLFPISATSLESLSQTQAMTSPALISGTSLTLNTTFISPVSGSPSYVSQTYPQSVSAYSLDRRTDEGISEGLTVSALVPSRETATSQACVPYAENECIKHICVDGQLIQVNKSQHCPYTATQPGCGLLGLAVRINGDKCCPKWECACRCSIFSDLSFVTFDGSYMALYKEASYILSLTEDESITVQVSKCAQTGRANGNNVTLCISGLELSHLSNQIVIDRLNRKVAVNGRYAWPMVRKYGYKIVDTGNMYLIDTPGNVKIQWFHSSGLMIIESNSTNKLPSMGLCGLCDGNTTNDLILPNGRILTKQEDSVEFLDSWMVPYTVKYVGKERHQDANCTTQDCAKCLEMIQNQTFSSCHPYVSPETFCDLWVQDLEFIEDPCKAVTAYVSMCHKYNVCIQWRRTDYCFFQCPESLQYQPCLPVCDVPRSCQNNEIDVSDTESCTGLTEGCVCPKGSVLHRSYSTLCIPERKCACTDSSGTPRAIGEVWKTSHSGCCMYQCIDNETIVPIETNCSSMVEPPCLRYGEVLVSVSDSHSCCPERVCVCNQSLCHVPVPECESWEKLTAYYQEDSCCPRYSCECDPVKCERPEQNQHCREDQTLFASPVNNSCCVRHFCGCNVCSTPIPSCRAGEILMVEGNSTELCCPSYKCVCDATRCPDIRCDFGTSPVEIWSPDTCCPYRTCECSCDKVPVPECKLGEKLQIDEEFQHSASNICNCTVYKCVQDSVCLSKERGVLRPGQTIMEHRPDGTCHSSHCTPLVDPVTKYHRINVTSLMCAAKCQANQVYDPPRDLTTCCGRCRNVSCLQTLLNGTLLSHRPGTSWISNCVKYDCTNTSVGPVLLTSAINCPPFNETECVKMGGYVVSFLDGCCKTCKEDGKFCKRVTVRMTIRKNDCRSHTPVNIVSCDGKCPSASIYNYNINTYARFCKCCRELGLQRRVVQLYCSGNSTWVNYSIQEPTDCSCQWS
ncbi:otogelin [Xenopus laevis]|uniref:Otogelin n=1 Tax=Xenopus laevis TaxID=8355 RepID=A0A8J1MVT7_XENLA|nr:otogelin [Xenopus laevis]